MSPGVSPGVSSARAATPVAVVLPRGASALETLAAREVRRYLYLRTGELAPIVEGVKGGRGRDLVVVGRKDRPAVLALLALLALPDDAALRSSVRGLAAEEYRLKAVGFRDGRRRGRAVLVAGGDGVGTLYGAYRFARRLGVRFYLHGDVIPDEQIAPGLDRFAALDRLAGLAELDETGRPLFALRGILPFHDFPEGPDWWNEDDYKAVLAQLPKLGMNFFGLHTYPEGGHGPEPAVWIGVKEDAGGGGVPVFSARSRHFTTQSGTWGYAPAKTSEYAFGAAAMFERDAFGADYMEGMAPWPGTPEDRNELFDRYGRLLARSFAFARALGVKTCLGTESPLTVPREVKERLKAGGRDLGDPSVRGQIYEGIFQRIIQTHPLDYYWLWTPEGWTWGGAKKGQVEATLEDLRLAVAAAEEVRAPFTIATCGWVLGPKSDRALFDRELPKSIPLSCISREVGFTPVERGFARVEGRPTWSIPWLEDDPAMVIPQLWVGRMRRDAADSLAYGCTGLMGIHWRTREVGPNVAALARAAWEQEGWNPDAGRRVGSRARPGQGERGEGERGEGERKEPPADARLGGKSAAFPGREIADTEEDAVYRTVRYDVDGYRLRLPDGTHTVTLKFCEPHYTEKGKRVFGAKLQGRKVIDRLDIFARAGKDRALDFTFTDIRVAGGVLKIDFVRHVELPSICAIVVEGMKTGPGVPSGVPFTRAPFTRRINCGGGAHGGYEADFAGPGDGGAEEGVPRDLPADDFYADWALAHFGPAAAGPVADIFTRLDGVPAGAKGRKANLPRPATWVGGPGGIKPDKRPWSEVEKSYAFVDELAGLRPLVKGAGGLARFDYWLESFRYLRAVGRLRCAWGMLEKEKGKGEKAAREGLRDALRDVYRHLLATVTTPGAMGTVANWEQHIVRKLIKIPSKLKLELPSRYEGPARLIVPTVRTVVTEGEELKLKVIVLCDRGAARGTDRGPGSGGVLWRPIGTGRFETVPLRHRARGVYTAAFPRRATLEDIEYHVEFALDGGQTLRFPPTAPALNQTVVVMPR